MVALADYSPDSITDEKVKSTKNAFGELFNDPNFMKAITSGTNGKGAITTRIDLAKKAAQYALQ
jgi:hypothetical protein